MMGTARHRALQIWIVWRTFPLASTECPRDWLLQLLLVLHGWVADGQVQQLTCQQEALQHRQLVISGHKAATAAVRPQVLPASHVQDHQVNVLAHLA